MNINITFRHMEHTPALDTLIREKSEKFTKWFGNSTDAKWTCWKEGIDYCAEVTIHSGRQEYFAKAFADDMYKTFDMVLNKIQNQIQ